MQKKEFRLKKDMLNMMTQVIAIFIFEISFCAFILEEELYKMVENSIPTKILAFTRFITGISMHV